MRKIGALGPQSTLDLGVGFGKYGCLVREIQEAVNGRCRPSQFLARLDGVEAFTNYANPMWELYNQVMTLNMGDERNWHRFVGYDLVLAIDSLEHLDKPKAKDLLRHLLAKNKGVIVSVPVGVCPQEAVFGNEFEVHRASWYDHDFREWPEHQTLRHAVCYVAYIQGST